MRESGSLSFQQQIRFLRIIFFALLGGQAVFFIVAWIVSGTSFVNPELTKVLDYFVVIFLFGSIFLSKFIYRKSISYAKQQSFMRKTDAYRNGVIISLAVLELGNFTSMVAFMLSGQVLYVAASIIMFLLFILNAPSEDKFRIEFELTQEELTNTE